MGKQALKGLRFLFCNPRLNPYDLRGESHAPGKWKSERAMNFGLLVVASYISKLGAEVTIADFEESPGKIETHLRAVDPHVVAVGNISCYGFLDTLDIVKRVKAADKGILTVVGGQNARLSEKLFAAAACSPDVLVSGAGEKALLDIGTAVLNSRRMTEVPNASWRHKSRMITVSGTAIPLEESAFLHYELYPGYRNFFPLVEESRGCPCRCNFCGNMGYGSRPPFYQRKDPRLLAKEVGHAFRTWRPTKEFPCVLMCASFGNHSGDTKEFLSLIRKKDMGTRFLAAMRVDAPWEAYAKEMGPLFDQVHLGLESGSPEILLRMKKTTSPGTYLRKASNAIRRLHGLGIHVACNFILGSPGENRRSLQETLGFLLSHRDSLDSLWGGACIEYPGCPISTDITRLEAELGTHRRIVSPYCDELQAYPLDPSHDFTFEQMAGMSQLLMKLFNSKAKFYEHYRWYPGPSSRKGDPLAFYPEEKFFKLLFKDTHPKDLAFTISGEKK